MVGITLSSEQIRTAPADIRRWIEREVFTSLGLQAAVADANTQREEQLSACSTQEVAAILSQIQAVLPAVNVFFEFGRQGAIVGLPRVEAFGLLDIANHTRLQVAQVMACLDIINEALCRLREDSRARFCAFDQQGHCFVALQTQQNILHLWQEVIADQQLAANLQENHASPLIPAGASQAVNPNSDEQIEKPMTAAVFDDKAAVRQ